MKTIGKILLVRRAALCRGMGVLEKTDRIDAGMIAWYEQVKQVRPTEPASPQQAHLQALVVRLRQLTDVQTQQRQQARLVTDQVVLAGYSTLLGLVAAQIRSLEAARCEISCTSSRAWCASTIPILPPSMPPQRRRQTEESDFAWHSPTNYWCVSMPKLARYARQHSRCLAPRLCDRT